VPYSSVAEARRECRGPLLYLPRWTPGVLPLASFNLLKLNKIPDAAARSSSSRSNPAFARRIPRL